MKITKRQLKRIIKEEYSALKRNAMIRESIDPVTGIGSQEADEAIYDYMESYAEIFASEAVEHYILGPAVLQGDISMIAQYIDRLESFNEMLRMLKYDGVIVSARYLKQTLQESPFFDMMIESAQDMMEY